MPARSATTTRRLFLATKRKAPFVMKGAFERVTLLIGYLRSVDSIATSATPQPT